jgi:hypothetical protein
VPIRHAAGCASAGGTLGTPCAGRPRSIQPAARRRRPRTAVVCGCRCRSHQQSADQATRGEPARKLPRRHERRSPSGIRKRATATSRVAAAVHAVSPRSRSQLTAAAWVPAREVGPLQASTPGATASGDTDARRTDADPRRSVVRALTNCREQVTLMPVLELDEEARVLWQRAQHLVEQQQSPFIAAPCADIRRRRRAASIRRLRLTRSTPRPCHTTRRPSAVARRSISR